MKYAKYLLIALAAASSWQMNGMEDLDRANKWESATCQEASPDCFSIINFESQIYALERELAKKITDFNNDEKLFAIHKKLWNRARVHSALHYVGMAGNATAWTQARLVRKQKECLWRARTLFDIRNHSYDGSAENPTIIIKQPFTPAEICKDLADAIAWHENYLGSFKLQIIWDEFFANIDPKQFANEWALVVNAAEKTHGANHGLPQFLKSLISTPKKQDILYE